MYLCIISFSNYLKNHKKNKENILANMKEAYLAYNWKRKRQKIINKTDEKHEERLARNWERKRCRASEKTNEERKEWLAVIKKERDVE